MDEDTKRMLRVRKGDEEAFMMLFEKYAPKIISFLRKNGASRELAEDITQETFLRVWRERKKFLPIGTFQAWVYRIATNLFLNEVKRPAHENVENYDYAWTESGDQFTKVATGEILEKAEKALQSLPTDQRTALLLALEGLSCREGAKAMGISLSAYKTSVFRARKKLRELIFGGER